MPKIRITTERQPWLNGQPHDNGAVVDAADEDATALMEAGLAELAEEPVKRRRRGAEDAL